MDLTKKIFAEFVPQAWVEDRLETLFLAPAEALGQTDWDVTRYLLDNFTYVQILAMRDDEPGVNALRFADEAPRWVREWEGPGYVKIEASITQYFME